MRKSFSWAVGVFAGTSLALLVAGAVGAFGSGTGAQAVEAKAAGARAFASISGPGGITGRVTFTQTKTGPLSPVQVVAVVRGLPPGTHGFHVHEVGSCVAPAFTSAGGHFDPGPLGDSQPDNNHPFHAGDLPNLQAKGSIGLAILIYLHTNRFTLDNGPSGLFDPDGSAVIVHTNVDQYTTGVAGGAGGSRLACGVIQPG